MQNTVETGAYYQHYSGKIYQVIGVARDSETLEQIVVYKSDYVCKDFGKDALWVRSLAMFCEIIEIADGRSVQRFTKLE
jgi:hypothetical protein